MESDRRGGDPGYGDEEIQADVAEGARRPMEEEVQGSVLLLPPPQGRDEDAELRPLLGGVAEEESSEAGNDDADTSAKYAFISGLVSPGCVGRGDD